MTKLIPLTQGQFAIVDDEDYDWLMQWKWRAKPIKSGRNKYYATRRVGPASIFMHRVVNNTPAGLGTDHINGNSLDNRRHNLRSATVAQNARNVPKCMHDKLSQFKGITYDKRRNRWIARIKVNRTAVNLGSFATQEAAARAYDQAAKQHFGEFAYLNFPDLIPA